MSKNYRISRSLVIHADQEKVFKIMTDVEHWNRWTASVKSATLLNTKVLSLNAKVKMYQPKLLPVIWEVTAMEENKSFTWVAISPGLIMTGEHYLEKTENGTLVKLSFTYKGLLAGLAYWLTSALTVKYVGMEINGLKNECS